MPIPRTVRLMLAAALLAAPAHAQTSLAELEVQLAQARSALSAPSLGGAERLEALRRCDDVEKRLIAGATADDRVPTWLADRAACALDLASEDGAEIAVLLGVPTPAQVRIARARVREALDLSARADQAAAQVVARLEAQLVNRVPPTQGKLNAEAIEATLHVLVDLEQARRIPQIRAMAMLLAGAAATDQPTRETAHAAAREIGALPSPVAGAADERRVALGAALTHAAIGAPDRASDVLKAAVAQFAPVARTYAPGTPAVSSGTALRARLGLIRAGQDVPSRGRSTDEAAEREIDALEDEARAAALLDRASREPGGRVLLASAAIRALLGSFPTAVENELPPTRVLEKVAAAASISGVALENLPPEASMAWAIARVRGGGPGDPIARDEATVMLGKLAERTDAAPVLRTQARWERAVLAAQTGDPLAELDAVALVFRGDPEGVKAAPAARRAFDLFARNQGSAPGNAPASESGTTIADPWRARTPVLREAILLLLRRDPANAERWVQEAVRLGVREVGEARGADALERALAIVDAMPKEHRAGAAMAISEAAWRALDKQASDVARRNESASSAGARAEWEALVGPASKARAWSHENDRQREPIYTLLLGEAQAGAGDAKAAATLATLVGSALDDPDSRMWTRLKFALARAQQQAGEHAGALATLREVADRFEGAPGTSRRDAAYWLAWAEMLAILQSQNANSTRSPDIRVQIKRLELLDPNLGGSPYADRIRQVRMAVGE